MAFERHGRPFGLLLIDIDHFEKVNDVWGHEVGDAGLAAVGRTLLLAPQAFRRSALSQQGRGTA